MVTQLLWSGLMSASVLPSRSLSPVEPRKAVEISRRRSMAGTVLLALAALLCLGVSDASSAVNAPNRPNIVFILVDDLRWDDLGYAGHPFSRTPHIDRIAREGVSFRNAFATTPLCSPSRATILTGQYAHTHGIVDNLDRSPATHRLITFPLLLQRAGYETAFVGKWHMGNDDSPRPGFDFWACLQGQGSSLDASINLNGKVTATKGYVTDRLTDQALAFLQRPRSKPFLLYLSHKALHPETIQRADGSLSDPGASNFIPAERHKSLYAGEYVPRRPNALAPPEGKPALQRPLPGVPPLSPDTGSSDKTIVDRLRMLAAVDESTGAVIKALESAGTLDQTVVVFTGDHGYFYGEHGLSVERRLAYEESIRIPLAVRHPTLVPERDGKRDQTVLTIDIAPTLLELGGAQRPDTLQGKSFASLLKQSGEELRDGFLIEYYSDTVFPRMNNMGYQAVRTRDWKYIQYVGLPGMDELYDMNRDPYEMRNLAASQRHQDKARCDEGRAGPPTQGNPRAQTISNKL